MARLKLCDGRKRLYQWDTGVEIEICECKTVTECHFVTPSGLARGDVENNICKVPDSVLTHPGCLVVYAFARDGVNGTTRHDFRINVIARPKPADYIDTTDESAAIDAICDRLKELPECKGDKGEPGKDAAPYTLPTASAEVKGGVKVGNGLQMDGDVLGVVPEGKYEVIEVIALDGLTRVERTEEPSGTSYAFTDVLVEYYLSGQSENAGHVYAGLYAGNVQICYYGIGNSIAVSSERYAAAGASIEKGAAVSFATEPGMSSSSLTTLKRQPCTSINVKTITKVVAATSVTFPPGSKLTIKGVRANA